ncbi:MAG: hypothetical protein WA885_00640 [Phormidesmis sp.]
MSHYPTGRWSAELESCRGLARASRKVIVACGSWALFSAVWFLMGGGLLFGNQPDWFLVGVSLLRIGAFLMSAALCWRSAKDPVILSGRSVWQAIAVGMAAHALGDITVMVWRSLWGMTSAAALGDVFYGASYLFLAIGLLNAVLPRSINLSWQQTLGIATTGIVGIVLACWLNFYAPGLVEAEAADWVGMEAKETAGGTVAPAGNDRVPAIVRTIDERLSPIAGKVGLGYVIGDCVVVITAAALLLAFWGGTYSEAWKLIALAGLCLYAADMFLIYEVGRGSYLPGAVWEIFWILSALFFGLGADVERGVSAAMRQRRPKKPWM